VHILLSRFLLLSFSLINMSSSYIYCFVLSTESPLSTTKQVCGKLGKLGTNVVPAHSVFELARNNREVHSNINGISDLFPGLSLSSMSSWQSFFSARSSCLPFCYLDILGQRTKAI